MCKSGGFADKNHNEDPCPKCEAKLAEMYTWITRSQTEGTWYTHVMALSYFALPDLPERTDAQHRARGQEWNDLDDDEERKAHFKQHGTRWTAFSRLPYFDITRMMVIDPMHNLLLGT